MSLLEKPKSILSIYQEEAKFNFVWRINVVFTIVGLAMSIFTFLIDDRFFKFYFIVLFITLGSLVFLKYIGK